MAAFFQHSLLPYMETSLTTVLIPLSPVFRKSQVSYSSPQNPMAKILAASWLLLLELS